MMWVGILPGYGIIVNGSTKLLLEYVYSVNNFVISKSLTKQSL